MVDAGFNERNLKVFLHPLLAVNGSRVHDYMFDNDSDGTRNTMIHRGLLDLQAIAQIWMDHTQDAISREPLDFRDSRVCE